MTFRWRGCDVLDGIKVDAQEVLRGLERHLGEAMAGIGEYGKQAGERLAEWARNPPFPYAPEKQYTEREIVLFKTLARRGRRLRRPVSARAGGPYKWRDRTGEARKSIAGGAAWDGAGLDIYVSGGTEYFRYLELGNEKRFAVLAPAVNALAPVILEQVRADK